MIIETLFGKTARGGCSLEDPRVPLSCAGEMENTLTGGGVSDSGVVVNRHTSLSYAAVWRGLTLISRDVAKLPLLVYRRLDAGGKERATEHPAYRLLRRKPNEFMKAFDFKQTLTGHAVHTGNGYGYIFRRGDGAPLEILPLNPDVTWPVRENGRLLYVTTISGDDNAIGETRKLPAEDVLHIKGFGFDGLVGYDVLTFAKETFGLGIGLRRYGARFFRNNAAAGVVLEHPGRVTPEAAKRLAKDWDKLHVGLDRSHRTAVLEEGMKANVMTVDARRAQLKEMREFEIRDAANFLGVPPHKLGDTTRTAYASLEQENQAYLDEALDPWLVQWEQECTDKLMTEREKAKDSHFCEFVRDAIVRLSFETKTKGLIDRVNNGLMNVDRAREIENEPPLPNGEGQKYRIPANIKIIGDDDEPDEPTEPVAPVPPVAEPDDDDERKRQVRMHVAHDALLFDALRRMHTRVATQARKAAKRPAGFLKWLDVDLEGKSRAGCEEALTPALEVCASAGTSTAVTNLQDVMDCYFGAVRETLLTVSECQADELVERVDAWARETAQSLPRSFANRIMGREADN